jgi:hypothetical protein
VSATDEPRVMRPARTDLGWFARMAGRAAARGRARHEHERGEQERLARDNAPRIPRMDGESEPLTDHGEHLGHRVHAHPAHLGLSMCSCGTPVGSYSYIPPGPDDPPLPVHCPICDAHQADAQPRD